jgi:hypothetical protein
VNATPRFPPPNPRHPLADDEKRRGVMRSGLDSTPVKSSRDRASFSFIARVFQVAGMGPLIPSDLKTL